ncbi:hypothetical protein MPL1032_100280 [Mesorhizobium plurifarium]|uniref:Uncharacterized protein n=1 Tax=Mesorhizobium plurifarium TaxID=69974 RepID=A0A0K2VPK3_MESPL|nr:hypothetical protein MPL1032_100280 [Mesorhizobium plurifarium]
MAGSPVGAPRRLAKTVDRSISCFYAIPDGKPFCTFLGIARLIQAIKAGSLPRRIPRQACLNHWCRRVISGGRLGLPALGGLRRLRFRLAAEADRLGELRARGRIVGSDHRVVDGQAPFGAVGFGRQAEMHADMALQRFELLPVLEADDVVRRHRAPGIDGGDRRGRGGLRRLADPADRRGDAGDQPAQVRSGQAVLRDVGRYDVSGELEQVDFLGCAGVLVHVIPPFLPKGRENDPVVAVCNIKALRALLANSEKPQGPQAGEFLVGKSAWRNVLSRQYTLF